MYSNRIEWLDFGKGFTIFFVVLSHSLLYIRPISAITFTDIIGVFMMPVFFAISGYLYKSIKDTKKYYILIYKKVSGFLVPYFLFAIITFFCYRFYSLPKTLGGSYHSLNIFSLFFINHITYIWYLYILFIIFLIAGSFNLLCNTSYIWVKFFMIMVILFLIYLVHLSSITITNLIGWIICFLIGYFLKKYKIFHKSNLPNIKKYFPYMAIIWGLLVTLLLLLENNSNFYSGTDMFSKLDAIPKFLSIFVFFALFFLFKRGKIFDYFCKYGKYTLSIYLIHVPLVIIVGHALNNIINRNILYTIVFFIFIWYLSILICVLINHVKFLNYLMYPRHYLDKKI